MSGDLPDGWRWATIGEICREERVSVTNKDDDYGEMPYLGLEHIESVTGQILVSETEAHLSGSKSNNFRFTPDHVLYGKLRPYLNKVALPSFAGRCTTEIIPLKPTLADRQWLAWLLRMDSTVEYAMRGKTGSRMPRTDMNRLREMPVALPPMEEQRRVVAMMSNVERARSAATRQLSAIDELSSILLREIFPRSPAARLPRGWRWAKLGNECDIVNGSTPRSTVPKYWGGHIRWVTPADLGKLNTPYISGSERSITVAGYESCSTTLVPAGSVVLSTRAPIGHLGIATEMLCTNQGCKSLVPQDGLESQFLYYALRHAVDRLRAIGTGATFAEVSKGKLVAFEIPVAPLHEQRRIANTFSAVQRARAGAAAQLAAVNKLTDTLIRQLFSSAAG